MADSQLGKNLDVNELDVYNLKAIPAQESSAIPKSYCDAKLYLKEQIVNIPSYTIVAFDEYSVYRVDISAGDITVRLPDVVLGVSLHPIIIALASTDKDIIGNNKCRITTNTNVFDNGSTEIILGYETQNKSVYLLPLITGVWHNVNKEETDNKIYILPYRELTY